MLDSKGIATAPETRPTSAFQHVFQVTNYVVGAGISIGDTYDGLWRALICPCLVIVTTTACRDKRCAGTRFSFLVSM